MADEFWEDAARTDPLWAILSDPARRHRAWNLADFFATGRREISLLLHQLETLRHPPARGDALDFGCGVGRLTQALAGVFDHVTGVDVSPTMIRLAEQLDRWPGRTRYLMNDRPDLSRLPSRSLDFLYSDIVLQHIPPQQSRVFLAEFLRLLRPGGIAVFQLTAERRPAAQAGMRIESMPDAAYRARIDVDGLPASIEPDAESCVVVTVANTSAIAWDSPRVGMIRVGNHWLDEAGAMLVQDDGRTAIEGGVAPGDERRVTVTVRAPASAGRYLCEFDVVHEGVTWFADRGSRTWSAPVGVGEPAAPTRAGTAAPAGEEHFPDIYATLPGGSTEIGDFPMFGIPREQVLEIVEANGGRTFHLEADERGGPEWIGYRYFVVSEGH
jgi:SAM-dependent methyltransferase